MSSDSCRRQLCGHPHAEHAHLDVDDNDVGQGNGWCLTCHSAARCPSFVGTGGT
jgi:hypothetical protein